MKKRIIIWKGRSLLSHPLTTLLLVGVIIAAVLTFMDLRTKLDRARVVRSDRLEHLERIEGEHDEIKERLDTLETPYGIEYELRDKYRVVKEGEGVVVLLNQENATEDIIELSDQEEEGALQVVLSKLKAMASELFGS